MINIITHDNRFHASDVVAYTLINEIYPNNMLTRTSDENEIKQGEILISVGCQYDPANNKFDNHQYTNEYFNPSCTVPMSSAGMVYKKYGKEYIMHILNIESVSNNVFNKIYELCIKEIDSNDNGGRCHYKKSSDHIPNTNIYTIISNANHVDTTNHEEQMTQFMRCVEWTRFTLETIIKDTYRKCSVFEEEYKYIRSKLEENVDQSFIVSDKELTSYFDVFKKCRDEIDMSNIHWIIYPKKTSWRVCKIFNHSKKLQTLYFIKKNLTNKDDLEFVHRDRFTAGTKTLDSAIEIATLSNI